MMKQVDNHVVGTARLVTGWPNSRTSQLPESASLPQHFGCETIFETLSSRSNQPRILFTHFARQG